MKRKDKIIVERCWDQYNNTGVILYQGKEYADIIDKDTKELSSQKINLYSNGTFMYSDRFDEAPWEIYRMEELDIDHVDNKHVFQIFYEHTYPVIISLTSEQLATYQLLTGNIREYGEFTNISYFDNSKNINIDVGGVNFKLPNLLEMLGL